MRPHRAVAVGGLLAALGAAVATSLYAWLAGPLLRAVLTEAPVEVAGLRLDGARMLRVLPALLVGVALLKALSQYLQGGLMQRLAQGVMKDLREALHARLLAQPPAFFESRHSGEVLARFTQDVPAVEFSVSQALTSYVKDGLQVVALLVTCLVIDPKLFVVGFVLLPALVVPLARFRKGIKKHVHRTQGSLGALTQLAAEQLQSLAVVQAYRGEDRAMAAFDAESARYMAAMRRSLFLRGAFSPLFEFAGLAGVALVIAFGARAVGADPPLAGRILSFVAATMLLWSPLKGLTNTGTQVMVGLVAAERLFALVDAPVAPEPARRAGPLTQALVLEGVHAVYPDGREALRGLDVQVPAGSRVALVGASGAGKTSVFSVLLGFLPVSGGRVTWDGVELSELASSSVRAQVAWVPQEPVLFTGSVRHNLLLGRPEASDAQLWEALGHAHADAFVRARGGLDAFVGERGGTLSGGQRQRLALARAFLRQPSVLLLDEPTSALDAESEAAVGAGLAALMQGRTVLVIAHRLSTVRDADLIVVMDAGRVVESGTHTELVARGGRYAALLGAGDVVAA